MFDVEPPGFVTDRADWPLGLEYFAEEANLTDSQLEAMEVYRILRGIWDDEYLWKFELSQNIEEALIDGCGLVPIEPDGKAVAEFLTRIPDEWAKPDLDGDCECFSTPEFTETHLEGYIYAVIIDRESRAIYVWFIFIF